MDLLTFLARIGPGRAAFVRRGNDTHGYWLCCQCTLNGGWLGLSGWTVTIEPVPNDRTCCQVCKEVLGGRSHACV